jgi:hypothetical protein
MQHEIELLQIQERSLLHYIDRENELFVIGMKSLEHLRAKREYDQLLRPLRITVQWSLDFLCKSHVDLGRKGAVCPFTKPSIDRELFWLSLYSKPAPYPDEIRGIMKKYLDLFLQLPPQTGREAQYKTILVVFPHFKEEDCKELIDNIQQQLKLDFVSRGLMIGQFHANCQESGLWNSAFRPLQSPFPMLVIRNMVISDYPFLEHDQEMIRAWTLQFPEGYKGYLDKVKSVM